MAAFLNPLLLLARTLHFNILSQWMRQNKSRSMTISDRSSIILSPHQDDETLGCGGLIALKRQRETQVAVVFLTDGGGIPGCQEQAQLRRQEAIDALNLLGVSSSDIYFLNYPDGKLQELSQPEQHSLVGQLSALFEQYQAQEVYVPHFKDGHLDHEVAFQLGQAAIAKTSHTIELIQYPIWLFWKRPFLLKLKQQDLRGAFQLDITSVKAKKHDAIQVYQSQLPVLPFGFLIPYLSATEVFFVQSTQDTLNQLDP